MLNLRENFYNPRGSLHGADAAITSLTEMQFDGDGTCKGKGGRMQEFSSGVSEDWKARPDMAKNGSSATGTDVPLHDIGTQRQETESSGGNIVFMEEEDPKV